jgi:hypothetical protein
MRRTTHRLALTAALLGASAVVAASQRPLTRAPTETRVVPPLADPAIVPGVGRCTSDGRCSVTDERGTRRGTPFRLSR